MIGNSSGELLLLTGLVLNKTQWVAVTQQKTFDQCQEGLQHGLMSSCHVRLELCDLAALLDNEQMFNAG